jgi:hypothetical protein
MLYLLRIRRLDEDTGACCHNNTSRRPPALIHIPRISSGAINPGCVGNDKFVIVLLQIHHESVIGNQLTNLGVDSFEYLVDIQGGADHSPDFGDDGHFLGQPLGSLLIPALLLLHALQLRF